MRSGRWRRFLPKRPRYFVNELDGIFSHANTIIARYSDMNFDQLDRAILAHKKTMDDMSVSDWLALTVIQAPRAAHAQSIMNEYPHGYHDRKKRLFELIDFNDTFCSTVLLLPEAALAEFVPRLKLMMDEFCHSVHSRPFDDDQFEAVVHGLSREIAVFKAADNAGLEALMSSRVADAFGIDMQIADTVTGHYVNIDCKTSSAFHFRLKDLIKRGRVPHEDLANAETLGWWEITNKGDHGKARIILLRVSQDEFGEIRDFRFTNEQVIVERLRQIIAQRGLHDGHFGGKYIDSLE